jgi:hypothetical protein
MSENTPYDKVLQELAEGCGLLIEKHAPKLHGTSHEDNSGTKSSNIEMVRKIQEDCIRLYTDTSHGITFPERLYLIKVTIS